MLRNRVLKSLQAYIFLNLYTKSPYNSDSDRPCLGRAAVCDCGTPWTFLLPFFPTKFQLKWPFSSGEEAKHRFSRWPFWISNPSNFSYF